MVGGIFSRSTSRSEAIPIFENDEATSSKFTSIRLGIADLIRRHIISPTGALMTVSVAFVVFFFCFLEFDPESHQYDLQAYPSVVKFNKMYPNVLDIEALIESANLNEYDRARKLFSDKTFGLYRAEKERAIKAGFCPSDEDLAKLEEEQSAKSPAEPKPPAAPRRRLHRHTVLSKVNNTWTLIILANKELGFNIEAYIPWAYYLHLHGCEYTTRSFHGFDPFFWFSRYHRSDIPLDHEGVAGIGMWGDLGGRSPWKPLDTPPYHVAPTEKDVHPPGGLKWPPFKAFFKGSPPDTAFDKQPFWRSYHRPIFTGLVEPHDSGGFLRDQASLAPGSFWPNGVRLRANKLRSRRTQLKIAVVMGKHTTEWSTPLALNTFADPRLLEPLLNLLLDGGFVVFYNRPRKVNHKNDSHQDVLQIGDYDLISAKYKDLPVFSLPEFVEFATSQARQRGYLVASDELTNSTSTLTGVPVEPDPETVLNAENIAQMSLLSMGDYFVSTQGGNAALASLFAEKLFIYHRFGPERMPPMPGYPTIANYNYKHWWQHNGAWVYADSKFANLLRHLRVDLMESTGLSIPEPPNDKYEDYLSELPWKKWRKFYKPED